MCIRDRPKPWTEGDKEVVSASALSGSNWNYVLLFEAFAQTRNKMMFTPSSISAGNWTAKYGKMALDCHIKETQTTGETGQTVWTTSEIYTILSDPKGNSVFTGQPTSGSGAVNNQVLQWIEEAALDLVCLATDVSDTICDNIRAKWQLSTGQHSDCWLAGWEAVMGHAPPVVGSTLLSTTYCSTCTASSASTAYTSLGLLSTCALLSWMMAR
eukprot:TRINITY_DN5396_c0_g1_i1.p1 TRINITY_DN5396_c0_g1~~TRINITY_DN5396_c0_g1_i1.p1  ORF type:complete len:213 (+),score=59.64 TRINITY_DN5396_c0_g1_i1:67-705(+)